jgi:hypothetical protein
VLVSAIRVARALCVIVAVAGAAACASDAFVGEGASEGPWCVRPAEGCPCDDGAVEPCALPEEDGVCRAGLRTCHAGAWSGCGEAPPAAVASVTSALLDDTRDFGVPVPTCTECAVSCFVAIDDLDPGDGPLDSSNSSGGTVYNDPAGISLFTNPTGYPGDLEFPDVMGDHPPLMLTLLPGETESVLVDSLTFGLHKLDVYFLVDLNGTMAGELATLVDEITGSTDYIGATPCVDADDDGTPDPHGRGLIEAARCFADDVRFGAGYFRELPFAPHAAAGEVAYGHLQDIAADAALTESALMGLSVRDLSAFADEPTSAIVALEALATRDGFNLGLSGPSLDARTSCPAGTRGYPCFRDDAMLLVVLLSDRPIHNGPSGNPYAASYSIYPAPATTVDQAAQTAVGTFADPFVLGDVTATFRQFTGVTSGASTVGATTVSCGAADATADAVHRLTISGLATGATTPLTLTTEGSAFDTVLSLHDGIAKTITPYTATITNNALTDTEVQGYRLPSSTLSIDGFDLRTVGGNTTGRGAEIPSSVMGCLGNDARAPDTVFRFDVAQSGTQLEIDTEGSSFDTVIALFEDHVLPVPTPWQAWVEYDEFFPEGWDQWNRNGDGTLCNGGACDSNWTCDSGSGSIDKWCGFYVTGTNPVIDDLDCYNGSACVIVINAPGQTVRLDHINVEDDSTFYIKVISAAYVEMDGLNCEDNSRCGIDFGPAGMRDTGDSDINCKDDAFCYIRHNQGPLVQVETYNRAVLQIECGPNSQCGDSTYSECDNDATCILKKAAPSTVNVGMTCDSSAACICLEGSGGATGCRNFCGGSSSPPVCANANGQDVLNGGGPTIPGVVRRIACDDNGAADGVRSKITTGPLDAGTYYVVVKGKALNRFGAYQLRIRDVSGDARLDCNDDAIATVSHSTLASVPVGNGTYYAVVTGTATGEQGAYKLTAGTGVTPITYTPPSYASTIAALNAADIRVATVTSCAGATCTQANADARTLANDSRAIVDLGAGDTPLAYTASSDGSDIGAQVASAIRDHALHTQLDVALRVLDEDDDPAFDPNPFVTTIAPDDASQCQGISGSSYLRCSAGDVPVFALTFSNPPPPGQVADNPNDPYGAYGFALQLYATRPGTSSPEYVLDELPVVIVPNTIVGPVPPEGTYTQTLESRGCPMDVRPVWSELVFGANVPLGTSIRFQTCAEDEEEDLDTCALQDLLRIEAVDTCGSGCPAGTLCSSELPDVSPNDVCLRLTSSTSCMVDADCPVDDSCFHGICVLPGNWPDISAALPRTSLNKIWTRYDIELRANSMRTVGPTLDYWHVQYLCVGLN